MIELDFLQASLGWRYATKKFDKTKKLSAELFEQIINAMRMAPSSYGVQPWKFFVVQDADTRARLRAVSFDQPQVTDCSHLVVVTARQDVAQKDIDNYINDIAKTRNISVSDLAGFSNMMSQDLLSRSVADQAGWASRQAYIALGFGLLTASLLRVDACPMEGFDKEKVSKELGLDDSGYFPYAYLALGYRDESDEMSMLKKVRYDEEKVVEVL